MIELIPDQILSRHIQAKIHSRDGKLWLDPEEDLVLLACVERHHGSGNVGLGLVKSFGLLQGALASSVSHDSHHIVAIGRDPAEMFLADGNHPAVCRMKRSLFISKGRFACTSRCTSKGLYHGGAPLVHLLVHANHS